MIDCANQPVGAQERARVKRLGMSNCVRTGALILFFVVMPLRGVAQSSSETVEKGSFKLHSLLHAIGEETYDVKRAAGDELVMSVSSELTDRSNKRSIAATLRMKADLTPTGFEQDRGGARATPVAATPGQAARLAAASGIDSVEFSPAGATVREGEASRVITTAARFFVGFGASPVSIQMMMMRYWIGHGKPVAIQMLRAIPGAPDVEIEMAGTDNINVDGRPVPLTRYTVANIVFGREILWMNAQGQLAALMTFAGGLPFEAVRTEYEPALSDLFHAGVAQEMRNLAAIEKQVPPERTGTFAIVGATLVDGTGRPPTLNSVVIVKDGRIVAAGRRREVQIPGGIAIVDARGQTLLPGLWEMHIHFSGVEFGPALLAAGITTARDCGGEFEFLTTERDEIDQRHGLGPRLLLAGLVDASGINGFGAVTADTPDEARTVVDKYKAAGFQQIKLYTYLKPAVIGALSSEAHRVGMSVTGHVPNSVSTYDGIEAGMDQINHLNYVSRLFRAPGSTGAIDFNSPEVKRAIQFLLEHHTVVDPTLSWGEMAGHSKDMDVTTFEPGILKAPYTLSTKYLAMGVPATDSTRVHARQAENLAVVDALYKAGVPIVAGSDTGLVGYGLDRELELYVQAGMTTMSAIQSATSVPARAMKLDGDSGTIEAGKRADMVLINGNPVENIHDIRKVSKVVTNGWMYDSEKLWESVGFRR
jgi:imidazolonepropionase-like amidohydrolase